METRNEFQNNAELTLWNRKSLHLYGIEDVISFDDLSVYLITKDGNLLVEGSDLHITELDVSAGKMAIDGHIRSMIYHDNEPKTKNGFLSKIFK
jgi:sporulation protein YabP